MAFECQRKTIGPWELRGEPIQTPRGVLPSMEKGLTLSPKVNRCEMIQNSLVCRSVRQRLVSQCPTIEDRFRTACLVLRLRGSKLEFGPFNVLVSMRGV